MSLKHLLIVGAAALGLILATFLLFNNTDSTNDSKLVDDWVYEGNIDSDDGATGAYPLNSPSAPSSTSAMQMSGAGRVVESEALGFSVGGAKDINNFRENLANRFLPLVSDITFEGLIYDYYFDTGQTGACASLFCPSYSYAVSRDPVSGELEYYLTVGLNSGLTEDNFERKKLNLVIVLDISGSMGSPFDRYHYDSANGQSEDADAAKSKMRLASEAVVDLLGHLRADDRFGVVLFHSGASVGKPLSLVGNTDMESIKGHIMALAAQGGTNMAAGYQTGAGLFEVLGDVDPNEYENRIIFLTDAMPNTGDTSEAGLLSMTQNNADQGLYTTFIGIGVDFNTSLIERITKIRGANYYSVHSAQEFKQRMDEGFEFMVTPLVFDLALNLSAQGFEIEKVYGSPSADEATGELMKVNTLFPSKTENGETKGGIVLLKLRKTQADENSLILSVSYKDRNGTPAKVDSAVVFGDQPEEFYQNDGIRKGVLLARYVDFMQNWIQDERVSLSQGVAVKPAINATSGIPVLHQPRELGQWERQSVQLSVMAEYQPLLASFSQYFEAEMSACNDESLKQEMSILNQLVSLDEG